MYRLTALAAMAGILLTAASPVLAQGRFGDEAKQRNADRAERDAIRRAEHPELYEKPAEKPAPAPAQEAAAPAQAAEAPAAAAPAPAAPAPAQ